MPDTTVPYRYDAEEEIKVSSGPGLEDRNIRVRIKREDIAAGHSISPDKKGADRSSERNTTGKVLDLEIYLTPEQHTEFLKHFIHNQRGISPTNLCYAAILQHHLARFQYGKIGEKDPEYTAPLPNYSTRFEEGLFYLSVTIQKWWKKLAHALNKRIGFSEEQESRVMFLMKTLRSCSERFADLEKLINNPPAGDVHTVIENLRKKVIAVCEAIQKDLEDYQNTLAQNLPTRKIIATLIKNLDTAKTAFIANLEKQKEIQQGEDPLSLIFNIQDRSTNTASLGSFIAGQLIHLCGGGIDEIYRIGGGRGAQFLLTHPALKHLSDAKSDLNARARSLHGVAHNNGRSPYSPVMIASLQPSVLPDDQKGAWIKMTDYVENGLGNWEEIDKILCHLTGQPLNAKRTHKHASLLKIGLFISSLVELFLYTPFHLLFTIFSFTGGLLFYVLPFVTFTIFYTVLSLVFDFITALVIDIPVLSTIVSTPVKWLFNVELEQVCEKMRNQLNVFWGTANRAFEEYSTRLGIVAIDDVAETLHHKLSCVKWCKDRLEEGYQRDEKSAHKAVFGKLKGHTFSLYNQLLSRFSGHQLVHYLTNFLTQTIYSATSLFRELGFLFQPKNAKKRRRVFEKKREEVAALWEEIVKSFEMNLTVHSPSEAVESSLPEKEDKDSSPREGYWPLIVPQPANSTPSILFFPEELVLGFFGMTERAFRNNGFSATALFALSCLTLGTLAAPGTVKIAGLRDACIYLNKLFGQNVTDPNLAHQVVGVTLQWQVSYASYEGGKSLLRGKTELIEWILDNSEKIVLGLIASAIAGKLLQYIPPVPEDSLPHAAKVIHSRIESVLPAVIGQPMEPVVSWMQSYMVGFFNSFPMMLNAFREESSSVGAHGAHPFKDCEQAVFGIKFLLILHSLVSTGGHSSHSETDLAEVREEVEQLQQEMKGKSQQEKEKLLQEFLKRFPIVENLHKEIARGKIQMVPAPVSLESNAAEYKATSEEDKLEKAGQDLQEAILVSEQHSQLKVLRHAMHPTALGKDLFNSKAHAALYFDYLTEKFDDYRAKLKARGLYHQDIEDYQKDYLHSFYNKHCYEGTTTLVRLLTLALSLALFYLPTLLYREFKYFVAGTSFFYSPATRQQIKMEYANDKALCFQLLGLLAWIAKGVARPLGYVLRAIGAAPVMFLGSIVVGLVDYSQVKSFNNACLEFIAGLAPHRGNFTSWLWPTYAGISRTAGINDDALSYNTHRLLGKLREDREARLKAGTKAHESEPDSSSDKLIQALIDYKEKVAKRWRGTDSARVQQVKVLSAVARDEKKTEEEKKGCIQPLYRSLPNGSELKQAIHNAGFFKPEERKQVLQGSDQAAALGASP